MLFVYSPDAGSLELIANGGDAIKYPLQRAFCKAVLGIDIPPAHRTRPVYRLQQILDPIFAYPTSADDGIGRVQLKSIRWKPLGAIKQLKANVQEFEPTTSRSEWMDLIRRGLAGYGLSPTQAIVEGATFRVTLARNGSGRARTVEFTVVLPSRFRVSSKSDEMLALGNPAHSPRVPGAGWRFACRQEFRFLVLGESGVTAEGLNSASFRQAPRNPSPSFKISLAYFRASLVPSSIKVGKWCGAPKRPWPLGSPAPLAIALPPGMLGGN